MSKEYVYSYYDDWMLYRAEKKDFTRCSPGNGYKTGFGFITETSKYLSDPSGIDGMLTEEEAKQFIRDKRGEEPVNFDLPARSYKEYERTHPTLDKMKESMGLSDK